MTEEWFGVKDESTKTLNHEDNAMKTGTTVDGVDIYDAIVTGASFEIPRIATANIIIQAPDTGSDITFYNENKPTLTLTKDGFLYKGELIQDAGKAYNLFTDFFESGMQ